jgi:hypothetical protein
VIHSSEHSRVRVYAIENPISIHKIVGVSSAALFDNNRAVIRVERGLERYPELLKPSRFDHVGEHNIPVPIEGLYLPRGKHRFRDAALSEVFID